MATDVVRVHGQIRTPLGYFQQQMALNEKGELLTAAGLPVGAEMVRKGQAWGTMSVDAVAGLVVRPTTVAAFEIFNGYAAAGKSLIIDRVFWHNLVSTNVIESFSGWAAVTTAKSPVTSGSFVVRGNSGKSYGGPVIAAAGTTVLDSGWFPWGGGYTKGAGGVVPHGAICAEVNGRLVVPPQCSLCLHVVSSLVGQTFTQGVMWYEEQLTIE
jgi:hypothetical protein